MKIKGSIDINKSRALVTELFADPDKLAEYQDGFLKKELVKIRKIHDISVLSVSRMLVLVKRSAAAVNPPAMRPV